MSERGHFETIVSHRGTRLVVAFGIGIALALYAFRFATDPRTAEQRAEEEAAVRAARAILQSYVSGGGPLEVVDPLAPKRALGKSFVYPAADGFEISGYYRRGEGDTWHPFLMRLDGASALVELSLRDSDPDLRRRAARDPKLEVHER